MSVRRTFLGAAVLSLCASLVLGGPTATVLGHLGDSSHIHAPGDETGETSALWCVRFTQDPGAWRPGDQETVSLADVEGVSVIFEDCIAILDGYYAVESYEGGQVSRVTVNEPGIGAPAEPPGDAEPPEDGDTGPTTPGQELEVMTVEAWTAHQEQWLEQGDEFLDKLRKAGSAGQARRALGDFQRYLGEEARWLRENRESFEPGTCLTQNMVSWESSISKARKKLSRIAPAASSGSLSGVSSGVRGFTLVWDEVEQVSRDTACDS